MRTLTKLVVFAFVLLAAWRCTPPAQEDKAQASVTHAQFGVTRDSTEVEVYTITNANGMEMEVITYGAIIRSLKTPDRNDSLGDIVLGFDNLQGYLRGSPYFGAVVGRYGNRIAGGKFSIDGVEYELATNDGQNHLHGGRRGFDKVVWTVKEEIVNDNGAGIVIGYTSPDMEEGYPGNLDLIVTYFLRNDNALEVDYHATTDKKTVVNVTQHSYFNLSAMASADILGHELMINASRFLPVDNTLIPTGEMPPVEGTPFDFTTAKPIGRDIAAEDEQLQFGKGFDHCWVLDEGDSSLNLAARLSDPVSGRVMEVYTTEPGLQFYSGNFLNGSLTGKNGVVYGHRAALCLETQHYPDSPNQEAFPSTLLSPGEAYATKTVFRFYAEKN